MRVLIGIPTYRRPEMLRRCLESVMGQRAEAEIDIFVADNDSEREEGVAVAGQLGVPSIVVAERGVSQVRNAILMHGFRVGADFIAMIDDDETASPNWIASLLEMRELTGAGVIAGPAHPDYAVTPTAALEHSRAFAPIDYPDGFVPRLWSTNNFMVSTRLLFKLDWPRFNPAFGLTGGGDREWFTRLRKAGATFAWSRKAVTYEHIPESRMETRWILRRSYRCGIDDMRIGWRHEGPWATFKYLARAVIAVALAPVDALLLLPVRTRLWILRKWFRAAGRFAALVGVRVREYA